MLFQNVSRSSKLSALLASATVVGAALVGCSEGVPTSSTFSPEVPVAQTSTSAAGSEVVTLYFDGNPTTFLLSDLAVALALFLDPDASVSEIKSTALDIFGIALTDDEIIGAGPNPIALYDLNGDGQVGTIQDLGVAVAAFLGATTRAEAEQIGIDLGITLNIAPGFQIPGPNATPFPFPVLPTIIDLAHETPDLSLLVEAVERADLVDTLNGFGPFTVFAPNDTAFMALLMDLGFATLGDVPLAVLEESSKGSGPGLISS